METTTTHPDSAAPPASIPAVCNVASHLPRMAREVPDTPGIVITRSRGRDGRARYASITFAQLEELSNRYANGLSGIGIGRGMRVLVMVRPGFEFIGLIFALFKMGAVPVMIDPGMGIKRLLSCVRGVDLQAFIGIPIAQVVRALSPRAFGSVGQVVTVGRRWCWGGSTLRELADRASSVFTMVQTRSDETAAILFTSGSTGPPKGVVYQHGMFEAQVGEIRDHYGIKPGEVDLPSFPLFALFSVAMGMTAVIPDMDPSRPARANPARLVEAISDHEVTNAFGSPALWKRVAAYCVDRGIELPTLRRVLIAGAPVPYHVIDMLHRVLTGEADVHTPYGATESLPVSSIAGREVLGGCSVPTRSGAGICVGKPMPGIEVRIIRITDHPIRRWSDDLLVADGEPGEIVVAGPVVTREYFGLEEETALAKIRDGDRIWHRMGDIGYRDGAGRIWFGGRKAHRVLTEHGTMFTVCCETIFNEHPDVFRTALVGIGPAGAQKPILVVEPELGRSPGRKRIAAFRRELLELGAANDLTARIDTVLFHDSFPVDTRHNVKIDREALAVWAAERIR